jgi:hypothetical protein
VDTDGHTISTPFPACSEYTKSVLNIMKQKSLEDVEKVIINYEDTEEETNNPFSLQFTKKYFKLCLWIYRKPGLYTRLSINESSFNYSFVWPIMELAIESIATTPLGFATTSLE